MISPSRLTVAVLANLANGFRSWRILVLLLLAVLGSGIATAAFTKMHAWADEQAQSAFAMQQAQQADGDDKESISEDMIKGEFGRAYWKTEIDDEEAVSRIVRTPFPALFFTGLLFLLGPLLSAIVAGPGLAAGVGKGNMRYLVLRATRLEIAIAHFKSSSVIVLALMAAGGITCFAVSTFTYEGAIGETAVYLVGAVFSGWILALPYIGLATAVSQVMRSAWSALGVLIFALFGMLIAGFALGRMVASETLSKSSAHALGFFLPDHWDNHMYDPGWLEKAPVVLLLFALSIGYFFLGYLVFRKRDL